MRNLSLLPLALLLLSCADTDALAGAVESSCELGGSIDVSGLELARIRGPAKTHPTMPSLVVGEEEIRLDWDRLAERGELPVEAIEERLRDSVDRIRTIERSVDRDAPLQLALAVDMRRSAADGVALLSAAGRAGFQRAFLIAAPSQRAELPKVPDPDLLAELLVVDAAERAMRVAEAIDRAIVFCPDLTTVFSAVAAADAAMKCELLAVGIRESSRFPCLVDEDAFVTAIVAASVASVPTTFHPVGLDGDEERAKPAPGADWSTWMATLTAK